MLAPVGLARRFAVVRALSLERVLRVGTLARQLSLSVRALQLIIFSFDQMDLVSTVRCSGLFNLAHNRFLIGN